MDAVSDESPQVSSLVVGNTDLDAALRNPAYPVEASAASSTAGVGQGVDGGPAGQPRRQRAAPDLLAYGSRKYLDMAAKLAERGSPR